MITNKKCRECGEIKSINDFYSHPKTADRLQPVCKLCDNCLSKFYYEKNLECSRAKRKKWQKQNLDKQKEYSKKYRQKKRIEVGK